MTNENTAIVPLVTVKDGKVFANSRDVAEHFGKMHKNVLRDIDALIEMEPSIALNFEPIEVDVKVGFGARKFPTFNMTRDGFTLLAMGFTGAKALQFKLAYIAAFNEMEAKLKVSSPTLPNFADPAAAAIAWAEEYRAKEAAKREVEKLKPLAMVGSRAVAHNHSLNRFARTLPGVNTMKLKADLHAHNYLYKKNGTYRVYAKYQYLFAERLDETYGNVDIFPTGAGRALIIQLYEEGRLTMKKGCVRTTTTRRLLTSN